MITGDGKCEIAEKYGCNNEGSNKCYVCCFNDAATPRDFFSPEDVDREDIDESEIDNNIVS